MYWIKTFLLKLKYYRWNNRLQSKKNILERAGLIRKFENDFFEYSKPENIKFNFTGIKFYPKTPFVDLPDFIQYFSIHSIQIPQPFYMSVKNAQLIGNMAVAVFEGNIILESTHNSLHYLNKTGDAKFLQNKKFLSSSKSDLKKAVSLVNTLSNNYYHWLIDVLPVIEPLYNELKQNEDFKILLRKDASAFQKQFLKLIGLKRNIYEWNVLNMMFDELIISSYRNVFFKSESFQTDIISNNSVGWLRQIVLEGLSGEPVIFHENIYISRNNSENRNIINEDKLDGILNKYNIEKIILEDHPIDTQIKLFRNAKRVIGPHGAGFTNILFSTNLKIIEFFPTGKNYFSSFHQISSYLGHQHFQLELPVVNKKEDMEIDVEDFEGYLKLIF